MTSKSTGEGKQVEGRTPSGDSPKRQGDKLGAGAAANATATASETGQTGDSPKRQGDKLGHAVEEAAKG
jgi:hypothetical protein